jgi:proteasome lid subunit RPN8/RPN11
MIKIPKRIVDDIVDHAFDETPIEACGLLAGSVDGVVEEWYPMTNVDNSPEHFSFSPDEQFEVLKNTRRRGLRILASYHSHPASPARPSEEDICLAYDPKLIYVIISLAGGATDVKAFRITGGRAYPCEMEIF